MEQTPEKKCPLCGGYIEGAAPDASGDFRCGRCGATGRYEGESLVAMLIPGYFARMEELERRNREILAEINFESLKGEGRDMKYLQGKHLERQGVLAEVSFLSYFREFVDRW
jgi:hypothetical protein